MKLIVDISEEDLNKIKKIRFLIGGKEDRLLQLSIINAIKNAVPERETTDRIEYGTDGYTYKYFISNDIPEREKGEWIFDGDCIHCNKCKRAFNNLIGFNFCPNCGADMRGKDNGKKT